MYYNPAECTFESILTEFFDVSFREYREEGEARFGRRERPIEWEAGQDVESPRMPAPVCDLCLFHPHRASMAHTNTVME